MKIKVFGVLLLLLVFLFGCTAGTMNSTGVVGTWKSEVNSACYLVFEKVGTVRSTGNCNYFKVNGTYSQVEGKSAIRVIYTDISETTTNEIWNYDFIGGKLVFDKAGTWNRT